jgi:hypothetical protein
MFADSAELQEAAKKLKVGQVWTSRAETKVVPSPSYSPFQLNAGTVTVNFPPREIEIVAINTVKDYKGRDFVNSIRIIFKKPNNRVMLKAPKEYMYGLKKFFEKFDLVSDVPVVEEKIDFVEEDRFDKIS